MIRSTLMALVLGLGVGEMLASNPHNSRHSSKGGRPSASLEAGYASEKRSAKKPRQRPKITAVTSTQTGKASFYGGKWHGGKTASGEIYNQESMTAAHRSLPFNTRVRVTNLRNGRSVVLRINNRGPFIAGRIIDVSKAAARKLGMIKAGVVPVRLEVLG